MSKPSVVQVFPERVFPRHFRLYKVKPGTGGQLVSMDARDIVHVFPSADQTEQDVASLMKLDRRDFFYIQLLGGGRYKVLTQFMTGDKSRMMAHVPPNVEHILAVVSKVQHNMPPIVAYFRGSARPGAGPVGPHMGPVRPGGPMGGPMGQARGYYPPRQAPPRGPAGAAPPTA